MKLKSDAPVEDVREAILGAMPGNFSIADLAEKILHPFDEVKKAVYQLCKEGKLSFAAEEVCEIDAKGKARFKRGTEYVCSKERVDEINLALKVKKNTQKGFWALRAQLLSEIPEEFHMKVDAISRLALVSNSYDESIEACDCELSKVTDNDDAFDAYLDNDGDDD